MPFQYFSIASWSRQRQSASFASALFSPSSRIRYSLSVFPITTIPAPCLFFSRSASTSSLVIPIGLTRTYPSALLFFRFLLLTAQWIDAPAIMALNPGAVSSHRSPLSKWYWYTASENTSTGPFVFRMGSSNPISHLSFRNFQSCFSRSVPKINCSPSVART